MAKENYCSECNIEFKIRHDADDHFFIVMFCPFCACELDLSESKLCRDEEDEL